MKHIKMVEIPSIKKEVIDFITCDICGGEISKESSFDVDEIEVRHKTGKLYPEGGYGEETNVDLCGKCFDEKLIPWLKEQGCNPVTKDWDW